jgi:AMMECR1 domain-containing protein
VVVSRGWLRGVLLPQVAVEQCWDRETFLAHTCQKAGLPPNAWRDPETVIDVFAAEVFGESS